MISSVSRDEDVSSTGLDDSLSIVVDPGIQWEDTLHIATTHMEARCLIM